MQKRKFHKIWLLKLYTCTCKLCNKLWLFILQDVSDVINKNYSPIQLVINLFENFEYTVC